MIFFNKKQKEKKPIKVYKLGILDFKFRGNAADVKKSIVNNLSSPVKLTNDALSNVKERFKKPSYKTYDEAVFSLKLTEKDISNNYRLHMNMKLAAIVMASITFISFLFSNKNAFTNISFGMIALICLLTYLNHSIKAKQIEKKRLLKPMEYLKVIFCNV